MKKTILKNSGGKILRVGATITFILLVALFLTLTWGGSAFASGTLSPEAGRLSRVEQVPYNTVITVDTSMDLPRIFFEGEEFPDDTGILRHTCTYEEGFNGSLHSPAPDGKCTLRRAILESSARPFEDRPIAIQFNIPVTDDNASLIVSGTYTIILDEALPLMERRNSTGTIGQVTIDGNTQPNSRTDGPPIIIDSADTSLEIFSRKNVLKHISWKGGGSILVQNGADETTIENIWMGLTDDGMGIHFREPTANGYRRLAIGGLFLNSDDNLVAGNTIIGAFASAIDIGSNKSGNIVKNNRIGTFVDGTVPAIDESIKCDSSFDYNPSLHYGGWGVTISGSNNEFFGNMLAGLHIMKGANDTSPVAIEIFGADNEIYNNIVGKDNDGKEVGVCGHAIKFSGGGHQIYLNEMYNSRISFEDSDESAILAADTSPLFGQNTLYGNLTKDGPGDILTFAAGIQDSLRFYKPARITQIDGTTIEGRADTDNPCPNCTIDFYLDDTDEIQEAFVWIGQTTADADGKFSFEMAQELPEGRGIRTMSTVNGSGIISGFGAGTTTEASQLYIPIQEIEITGPTEGNILEEYSFTVIVSPTEASMPVTYTIDITDSDDPLVAILDDTSVSVTIEWAQPGTKLVDVTADNGLGQVEGSFEIVITDPSATPEPTETQTPSTTPEPSSTPDPNSTPDPSTTPDPSSTPDPGGTPNPTSTPDSGSGTPNPTSTPNPSASGDEFIYLPVIRR